MINKTEQHKPPPTTQILLKSLDTSAFLQSAVVTSEVEKSEVVTSAVLTSAIVMSVM